MEQLRSTSRRGFSGRSIFSIVLAALLTVLLWAGFLSSTSVEAVGLDASWVGDSIVHDGRQYYPAAPVTADAAIGLPEGTIYYLSLEQIAGDPTNQKAHVIYFAPGADPPTAVTATYALYDYESTDIYSNPTDITTVKMTTQAESGGVSSCSVDGVGWFICPMTVFLAGAMDWAFEVVASFMTVQPLLVNDTSSALYASWDVMRNFANIAFIIAFLIIIYSQLTSWGVTNYGLKKLLPRLIVAAILVNVSFFISAIAVDLSNIAGYGLQNVLIEIRQDTFAITNETFTSWTDLSAAILSGGAITAGVVGLTAVTGASIVSAVYGLVPLLIGLLLTFLLVLLILAARQAIIIILIVIAPLAFVANLLPNTEKLFDRWKGLFITMLVFFPAFSLVFGGSQLAGGIIIQNSGGSILLILFGMAVQVAPLIITPLLLKLSGGLLGKIAGVMNDPRKGLMDRTKNWAGDRAKMHRAQSLNKPDNPNPFKRNQFRSLAKRMDRSNRLVKSSTDAYEKSIGANAVERDFGKYERLHGIEESAKTRLGTAENRMKQDHQSRINTVGSIEHLDNLRLEASNVRLNEETERTKAIGEEYRSGLFNGAANSPDLQSAMDEMSSSLTRTAAETQRGQSAQFMQKKNVATAFTEETAAARALQRIAGGVDPNGQTRSQANAESSLSKLEQEALDTSVQLLNFKAIKSGTTLKSYSAKIFDEAIAGTSSESAAVIEAAAEAVAKEGNISLLREARKSSNIDQNMMTQLFARNSGAMKAKGGFDLQADPGLAGASDERMFASVAATIGDITGDKLPDVKAGFWKDVSFDIDDIVRSTNDPSLNAAVRSNATAGLRQTYRNLTAALRDDDTRIKIGDRLVETSRIHSKLHALFGLTENQVDYSSFDVSSADINKRR